MPPARFIVVGAPVYFQAHPQPRHPSELRGHSCIRTRLPSGALCRWEFQRGEETLKIDPAGPLTLDNCNLMVAAAVCGAGLAWVNAWAVTEHLATGRLISVLDDWSTEFPGLRLYYPRHRHLSAGMRAFIAMARETVGDSAEKLS